MKKFTGERSEGNPTADIRRNLESKNDIYLSKFWTGWYSNRSPLFTPVSAMGIQLIARQDALWQGLNMMVSPQYTLRRRYGFLRTCPDAFGADEWPLTYYSFQNLAGTVDNIVDTQTNIYTFSSTGLTSIYTKASGAGQSSFNDVGNILYWVDGVSAKKWDGTTVSNIGIAAPTIAPTIQYAPNGLLTPLIGYQYGYTFVNPTTGHQSSMSPASANTGPLNNQTVVESSITVNVTSTSVTSNVITVICGNNFEPGQTVVISGLGTSTFLNGVTLTCTTVSALQFTAAYIHANYSAVAETQGTAKMTLCVPTATPWKYTVNYAGTFLADGGVVYAATSAPFTLTTGVPTVGQYAVTAGVYTFAAADTGQKIAITYSYSLAISTGVNIVVGGDGSSDPQVTKVNLYRTDDGGAYYYFLAQIPNPGGGATWSYTDSTPDDDLNDLLIAPVADVNDPPPAGLSLLAWYAGRLWGCVGNTLYFSGGPDTLNGVGEEAWPPINNFTVPGNITALLATTQGLAVFTADDAYAVSGTTASTFTVPLMWQANMGVANCNQVCQDGDNCFLFTTQKQLYNIGAGTLAVLSFIIQDQLEELTTGDCYLAVHRSGPDEGIFLSDGSTNLWRYSQTASAWDNVYQPVGGVGAIASIEMPDLDWALVMGRDTGSGYILNRDLNTWSDDGIAYPAEATIGSLTIAPPRSVANINSVLTQLTAVGTYPTLSVLLNEIADTGTFPATFVALPNPVPDPPQLPPSKTLWTRRHDFKAAQSPLSGHVSHMQIKIVFATEAQPNELLGVGLA